MTRTALFPTIALVLGAAPLAGQVATVRESLRVAEQRVSEAVRTGGLARELPPAMAADAAVLLPGAPIVRGKEAVERLLRAQTALAGLSVSWEPFRVLVSADGTLGMSFGAMLLQPRAGGPTLGRYLTVWQRGDGGAWRIAAHLALGLFAAKELALPTGLGASPGDGRRNPFTEADLAFARLAADSGAPAAFGRFVAPDGMTLAPTGELNLGPAEVRDRLAEGPAAKAQWKWWPLISFAAESGDLGATIGEAEIRLPGAPPSYSKYLTLWQRQADGSLKFVIDGGSGRPAP